MIIIEHMMSPYSSIMPLGHEGKQKVITTHF